MPAPFYPAIKGTTAGTPGTGAFTPNAASTGFRAWSTVPTGWIGLVRYDDTGNAWELAYSYWNGTTLSRASTQVYDSSTGSQLTLTSAATAAMVEDPSDIMSHIGTTPIRGYFANPVVSTPSFIGLSNSTAGTALGASLATTNYLTEQPRVQYTSGTTASSTAGYNPSTPCALYSTTAGIGGFEFVSRFGASQLPTGPRLFAGMTTSSSYGQEPSATSASLAMFACDSTDTNIQLLTKDGSTAHKVDTGIPLVANAWYETSVWVEPGGGKVWGLLIRLDTGAIWLGSTTTNLPANNSMMFPGVVGALNGANTGTAIIMHIGSITVRSGF